MKISTLYCSLLLSVLLVAGCGSENPEREAAQAPSASPADTAQASERTADPPTETRRILVLGNSIAAGNGVDPEQAFPALIQDKIDSLGWNFRVDNAGVSGETTAGGLRRLDWLLREPVDVLILELGGNDGLRGTPTEVTKENLQKIIDETRERYPDARIVLAGMQIPPNMGPTYTRRFRELYPELAQENDVSLIPFLLKDVGGIPELNQPDGIHPTAEGHRIVAQNVWDTLRSVLKEVRNQATVAADDEECALTPEPIAQAEPEDCVEG